MQNYIKNYIENSSIFSNKRNLNENKKYTFIDKRSDFLNCQFTDCLKNGGICLENAV